MDKFSAPMRWQIQWYGVLRRPFCTLITNNSFRKPRRRICRPALCPSWFFFLQRPCRIHCRRGGISHNPFLVLNRRSITVQLLLAKVIKCDFDVVRLSYRCLHPLAFHTRRGAQQRNLGSSVYIVWSLPRGVVGINRLCPCSHIRF